MKLSLDLDHPLLALLVFAALAAWALRAYARSLPPLPAARRLTLTGLRLAASLLLALMLGGLGATLTQREEEPPCLRILVDASASMARPAGADSVSPSRYDLAREAAAAARERWAGRLDVSLQTFGLDLREGPPPERPAEAGTDLGGVLSSLPTPRPGESVLLLSDGRDSEGGLWASELAPGRRVHAVLFGDTLPPPDLRIERIDAAPLLRKGSRLLVSVEIVSQGGAAQSGAVEIREGGHLLAEQEWSLEGEAGFARCEIPVTPEETGRHLLEIRVRGDGPDAAPENDRRLHTLRVVEGELRILVLAGLPDWDLSALMRGLSGERTLKLTLVTAGAEGGLRDAATGAAWEPGAEEYHGLLLHSLHPDWPPGLLGEVQVRGGALLMGALLTKPGSATLPREWGIDLRFASPRVTEAALDWGADAARHPALRGSVARAANPREHAPLTAVLANPLVGGRVLLRSGRRPVLATRVLGDRRLAVCSGRGFWRWPLQDDGGAALFEGIFSGVLRWLAREDPPDRLLVRWEDDALQAGRAGLLQAELFDEDFDPLAGARLSWRLRDDADLVAAGEFEAEPGAVGYRAELPALPEGVYRLEVEAQEPGGEILRRELELPVLPPERELLHPSASAETLRWLAGRSGGLFQAVPDLDALEGALDFTPLRRTLTRAVRVWQHPLLFLLLLALLAGEWGLRKRFGMV